LFVHFFRSVVYNDYEVSTNMPVGDVPREADWEVYIPWLLGLQPQAWQEVQNMARSRSRMPTIDLAPIIEFMGFEKFMEQVGLKRVMEQVGLERFVASLTPAQRQELKQRL
jgi:hypothetical protein